MVGLGGMNFDLIACDEALGYEKMTQGDNLAKNPKTKIILACHKNLAIFKFPRAVCQIGIDLAHI